MKYDDHKEASMTEKVTIYCNIFKWGINILDQLDVKYQRVFMATSAQDDYYRDKTKSLIKANIRSDGKIWIEKIHWTVIDLRAELDL